MLELGRFCVEEGIADPAVLRLAWGAVAARVETQRAGIVFGCSSFAGADAGAYLDAFALLRDRHLAPRRWLPRVKAPAVFRFARRPRLRRPDLKAAIRTMPPLLRSYLAMGGWVSDHAVIDRDLGTLHVFTGLDVRGMPPARARLMRAVAGWRRPGSSPTLSEPGEQPERVTRRLGGPGAGMLPVAAPFRRRRRREVEEILRQVVVRHCFVSFTKMPPGADRPAVVTVAAVRPAGNGPSSACRRSPPA
jgi:hypothetical protein